MTQTYEARMEGASQVITADTLEDAISQTEDWIRDGNWDTTDGTIWPHGYLVVLDEDGEEAEIHRVEVTINPPEPDCTEDEHDWQSPLSIVGGIKENPGVWGHGGGVVIHECCMHCGCERITDTWAQNPDNGQQGLESVRYEPGKYETQVEALRDAEEA